MSQDLEEFIGLANSSFNRNDFIDRLPDHLDRQEILALRARLAAIDLRFDIIGNLAVEVVANVFKNLSPSAPFAFHAVSKRWRHLLQSESILRNSLSALSLSTDSSLICTAEMDLASNIQSHYMQQFAFEKGFPFSIAMRRQKMAVWHHDESPATMRRISYLNSRLAWVDGNDHGYADGTTDRSTTGRGLCLWNLLSGKVQRVSTKGHESISTITLSTHLMAAVTFTGYCCAWTLTDLRVRGRIRLPNSDVAAFSSQSDTVAICVNMSGYKVTVIVWDTQSDLTYSFDVDLHTHTTLLPGMFSSTGLHPIELRELVVVGIIQAKDNSSVVLIVSTISSQGEQYAEGVFCLRFNLTGTLVSQSACFIAHYETSSSREYRIVPASSGGLFAIHMSSNSYTDEWYHSSEEIFLYEGYALQAREAELYFNGDVVALRVCFLQGRSVLLFDELNDNLSVGSLDFQWGAMDNSATYWRGFTGVRLLPDEYDPFRHLSQENWWEFGQLHDSWVTSLTFGDDQFLISLVPVRSEDRTDFMLCVQCFDPRLRIAGSFTLEWVDPRPPDYDSDYPEGCWTKIAETEKLRYSTDFLRGPRKWIPRLRSKLRKPREPPDPRTITLDLPEDWSTFSDTSDVAETP